MVAVACGRRAGGSSTGRLLLLQFEYVCPSHVQVPGQFVALRLGSGEDAAGTNGSSAAGSTDAAAVLPIASSPIAARAESSLLDASIIEVSRVPSHLRWQVFSFTTLRHTLHKINCMLRHSKGHENYKDLSHVRVGKPALIAFKRRPEYRKARSSRGLVKNDLKVDGRI